MNTSVESGGSMEAKKPQSNMAIKTIESLNLPIIDTLDEDFRPKRCRAVIFSPEGTKILGIVRNRPDRDTYTVYPGGGLEETDETAIDGITRELDEELALTRGVDYELSGHFMLQSDELFFVGYAFTEAKDMQIHGPEADRDVAVSGTYAPSWIPIDQLTSHRMFPEEISSVIENARN